MKKITKAVLIFALAGALFIPSSFVGTKVQNVKAGNDATKTGYTSAEDVVYKESGSYIANWGARGEDCIFLSKYAESFYTGNYSYEALSKKDGASAQVEAFESALYGSLKNLMTSKQTYQTSYEATKKLYRYTDCLRNDTEHISSFYSGVELTGQWDSAETWNREHTWPNSKGLGGNDENDIMMLRPTSVKENSSRGNTAYGISSGYFNPDCENPPASVKGDCARITLYVYTRWGNTGRMWGSNGVMESIDVLLRWMEEDPVDTWEMGRNDAVQSVTGTRNVFVDYPEYAWLLFGEEIPKVSTPSGIANGGVDHESSREEESAAECNHRYGDWFVLTKPTDSTEGVRERFCSICGQSEKKTFRLGEEEEDAASVSCVGSVSGVALGVVFAVACAYALNKRNREE